MLVPAINLVRSAARQVTCQSNLRQIGAAIQGYAQDWDGLLVPAWRGSGPKPWATIVGSAWNWRGALELWGGFDTGPLHGAGGNCPHFGCPQQRTLHPPATSAHRQATYGSNIRLSASSSGSSVPSAECPEPGTPLIRIGRNSEVMVVADGWWQALASPALSRYNPGLSPNTAGQTPEGAHRGRAGILYLDGHAGSVDAAWIIAVSPEWTSPVGSPGSPGWVFWKGGMTQ